MLNVLVNIKYFASNLLSCNTFNWKNYKLYNGNVPNIRYFTHQSMYWCWSLHMDYV